RDRLRDALNLTDQQESQVKKLHLDLEKKQVQVHSKIHLARLDMKEIYLSDKADRSGLEKLLKQVSDLQYQLKMNHLDFWFAVNGILTPEQQKIWKQHMGMMAGEMRDRMHRRMRHMGPPMRDMPDPPDED
ncbi:MAG: periplasmic heavy metal sensor, partial [Bacteroidota bacterium]